MLYSWSKKCNYTLVYTCNPSPQETEAGELFEFLNCLAILMRSCSKGQQQRRRRRKVRMRRERKKGKGLGWVGRSGEREKRKFS